MKAKKMDRPITIHEMENLAGGFDMNDIAISNDIGNIIEISDAGGGSASDPLGLGMLSNMGGGGRRGGSSGGGGDSFTMSGGGGGGGLGDIEVTNIESVEPVTLNLGGSGGGMQTAPIEYQFSRAEEDHAAGGLFSNSQTATGPGYSLATAAPSRMDPDQEKKEKMDYLNKLQRLEQKGFPIVKKFSMDNSLDEMKQEYARLVDARNLEASLRFQRQALMSVVTGLEWANGKFDPFDLKLDGWSEAVHENVEDFDEIFEELYDKYKERAKMPPEARLVMALAGSGFMCHVSNTFLKSRMSSVNADDILRNNPDLARQFASAAASQAGPGFGNFMNMAMGGGGQGNNPAAAAAPMGGAAGAFFGSSAQAAAQAGAEAQARARAEVAFQQQKGMGGFGGGPQAVAAMEPPRTVRREMSGPSGVDDILRTFEEARRNEAMDGSAVPGMTPSSPITQPAVAAAIEIQSMVSGDDIGSAVDSTRTGGRGRRRRAPVGNTLSLNV